MNFALYDHPKLRLQLLPFTYTRPVAEILMGVLTIKEKWQHYLDQPISHITENYLSRKYQGPSTREDIVIINGGVIPDKSLVERILMLKNSEAISKNGMLLAVKLDQFDTYEGLSNIEGKEYEDEVQFISKPWHIFKETGDQIRRDYEIVTKGRESNLISDEHTIVYSKENIFLEDGVSIKAAILNAERGPIYLGKNSAIEEGAVIRGPFSLGEESIINAKARIRGDSSIGLKCKVGGEVSNSVIFSHTNKGHDGFLGNSVLGEWCNIGADTNISNLKNNYSKVKVWDFEKEGFINTGEQFCGLLMGDHSKSGINTMFNTGTVVGVAANIFGAGFPRSFIPSFSWGGQTGFTTFFLAKVKEMASVSMSRRGGVYDETEEEIFNHLFDLTSKFRIWEH